jgi:hypothetical protein
VIHQATLAQDLFRAHVTQSPHQVARQRQAQIGLGKSQAEIGNPQIAPVVQEQVCRLDISVDNPHLMSVLQGFRGLNAQSRHHAEIVRIPRRLPRGLGCARLRSVPV